MHQTRYWLQNSTEGKKGTSNDLDLPLASSNVKSNWYVFKNLLILLQFSRVLFYTSETTSKIWYEYIKKCYLDQKMCKALSKQEGPTLAGMLFLWVFFKNLNQLPAAKQYFKKRASYQTFSLGYLVALMRSEAEGFFCWGLGGFLYWHFSVKQRIIHHLIFHKWFSMYFFIFNVIIISFHSCILAKWWYGQGKKIKNIWTYGSKVHLKRL